MTRSSGLTGRVKKSSVLRLKSLSTSDLKNIQAQFKPERFSLLPERVSRSGGQLAWLSVLGLDLTNPITAKQEENCENQQKHHFRYGGRFRSRYDDDCWRGYH
jgi:hypothetical protein